MLVWLRVMVKMKLVVPPVPSLWVTSTIGQIVEILKKSGKFDDSTLILTSDHSWRGERDPKLKASSDNHLRVPLIIKHSLRSTREDCHSRFCTSQLHVLLEPIFRGYGDQQAVESLVQMAVPNGPPTHTPAPARVPR